jgi:hypothetical protein
VAIKFVIKPLALWKRRIMVKVPNLSVVKPSQPRNIISTTNYTPPDQLFTLWCQRVHMNARPWNITNEKEQNNWLLYRRHFFFRSDANCSSDINYQLIFVEPTNCVRKIIQNIFIDKQKSVSENYILFSLLTYNTIINEIN